jgi:hypothetical protein
VRTLLRTARFITNPAGAAVVNTLGPIRQIVQTGGMTPKRYLVVSSGSPAQRGELVQVRIQPSGAFNYR